MRERATDLVLGSARHSLQGGYLPEELLPRLSGTANQRSACSYIRYDTSLRSNFGSPTNPQVPGNCRLPADLDEVLQHG